MIYHNNNGNANDLNEAFNRRRAKYAKQQKDKDKHDFITLTAPHKQSSANVKTLKATIGGSNNDRPTVHIIQENKGGLPYLAESEDEYEKYSKMFDGDADDFLLAQGATIISSTLELTDSSGRNRTIVRRNED